MADDLDDITLRRLAIEQAKAARRAAKIAESIAASNARRAAAAATCETPEALADHIQRSITVKGT